MTTRTDILGFVARMAAVPVAVDHYGRAAMEHAAQAVEDGIKDLLGHEQPEWPPLAESTLERKTGPGPLLETGEMHDSIEHIVFSAHEAEVGTDNFKAPIHEFGTERIPPRSFLALGASKAEEEVRKILGDSFVAALTGKAVDGAPQSVGSEQSLQPEPE